MTLITKSTDILTACELVGTVVKLLIMFIVSRSLTFHPEGLCLYCGCENQLKVYGWEPTKCFDTLTTGWSRVSDIAIAQKQLVSILFAVYLKRMVHIYMHCHSSFSLKQHCQMPLSI